MHVSPRFWRMFENSNCNNVIFDLFRTLTGMNIIPPRGKYRTLTWGWKSCDYFLWVDLSSLSLSLSLSLPLSLLRSLSEARRGPGLPFVPFKTTLFYDILLMLSVSASLLRLSTFRSVTPAYSAASHCKQNGKVF